MRHLRNVQYVQNPGQNPVSWFRLMVKPRVEANAVIARARNVAEIMVGQDGHL
jgi:hypothetical protein